MIDGPEVGKARLSVTVANATDTLARECPSEGHYRIEPNGLPVRVRDPSRESSQESRPAKDKTPPSDFKLREGCSESPGGDPKVKMKGQNAVKEGSKGPRSVPTNKEQFNKEKTSNDKQRRTAGEQAGTPLSLLLAKTTGKQTRASLSKSTKDNSPHRIRSQSRSKD